MNCPGPEQLVAHFEGQVPAADYDGLSAHLTTCAGCRDFHQGLVQVREAMAQQPEGPDAGFAEAVLSRLDSPPSAASSPRWALWATLGLGFSFAGIWAFVLPHRDSDIGEPQARGGHAVAADRWVALQVARSAPGVAGHQAVRDSVRVGDSLAFAYLNRADAGFKYLMVLGIGEQGDIHWFYPAYTDVADDPRAVPIAAGGGTIELKEDIQAPLKPGGLALVGLFSREPYDVRTIEALVQREQMRLGWQRMLRLPLSDTGQHWLRLKVENGS